MTNVSEINELGKPWAERIMAGVIETGRQRWKNFRAEFNEADYLSGAMAAMQALGLWEYVPATWTLGIMAGGTVVGERRFTDAERLKDLDEQAKRIREANDWGAPGEELEGVAWAYDNRLVLSADGYGGAWVVEEDRREWAVNERYFSDIEEARAFWDFLTNNDGDFEELSEAFVYQPEDE